MPSYVLKCSKCGGEGTIENVTYEFILEYLANARCAQCLGEFIIKPQLFSNHFNYTRGVQ